MNNFDNFIERLERDGAYNAMVYQEKEEKDLFWHEGDKWYNGNENPFDVLGERFPVDVLGNRKTPPLIIEFGDGSYNWANCWIEGTCQGVSYITMTEGMVLDIKPKPNWTAPVEKLGGIKRWRPMGRNEYENSRDLIALNQTWHRPGYEKLNKWLGEHDCVVMCGCRYVGNDIPISESHNVCFIAANNLDMYTLKPEDNKDFKIVW